MVRCERVIVVEGRYDKIKLSNLVEGTIIPCGGFSLFHNEGKKREIRTLARQKGAVILTDSDHVILSALQPETVANRFNDREDEESAEELEEDE